MKKDQALKSPAAKSGSFSRRKFIKGVGSTVAGAYLITPQVESITKKISKDARDIKEGKYELSFILNGKKVKASVKPSTTLAKLLREDFQLTGTKMVCNQGECGGCTVVLNGKAVYSCQMLALDVEGKEVITIEGLLNDGELNHIQKAFIEKDGLQCGFCTPGQIMSAYAFLKNNPNPAREEVIKGMYGNICRCSAYPNIVDSVLAAAQSK
jgi:aerobic-type carbon monoxide dehydrogenase small subunit (CoxS/CutS family)